MGEVWTHGMGDRLSYGFGYQMWTPTCWSLGPALAPMRAGLA